MIEIRRDCIECIDEIVAKEASVHLEMLSNKCAFLVVTSDTQEERFVIRAEGEMSALFIEEER